jgi:PAS domain S-box-containing protein
MICLCLEKTLTWLLVAATRGRALLLISAEHVRVKITVTFSWFFVQSPACLEKEMLPPINACTQVKRTRVWSCFFLLLFVVLAASSSHADQLPPVLALEPGQDYRRLGRYMEILEDPSTKMELEKAVAPSLASRYKPVASNTLNLGVSPSAFWLRFKVSQPAGQPGRDQGGWLLDLGQPSLAYVSLYVRDGSGWRELETLSRDLKPFPLPSRYAVFRLPDAPGQTLNFYMRVQGTSANFMDPQIFSQVGFLDQSRSQLWILGAYCGAILALAIYNLVMFFSLRDRSYLWYVLTIVSMALYYLGWNGLFQDYMRFLPVEMSRHLPIAFLSVLFLCRGQFARYFLLTNQQASVLDRIIITASIIMALVTIMVPLSSGGLRLLSIKASALGAMFWPWTLLFVVWRRWKQGFRPAVYFLVFYLPTAVGQLISMLTILKALPFSDLGFFSHQIAGYFEPILLALALGYRIRTLDREKQGAEQAARETELRHHLVMQAAPDPIAVCDATGRLLYMNPAFERVFGWSALEDQGRDISAMVMGGESWSDGVTRGLMSGGLVKSWETRFSTKQGKEIDIAVSAAALKDQDGEVDGLVLIMQDISLRKQSEAEKAEYQNSLRKMALEVARAEERERHRIAEDLHDSVSQSLAFSAFGLKRLCSNLSGKPREEVDGICQVLDQSIKDIRSLTFEISPPVLYDYGLAAALEWLAANTAERHDLEVELKEQGQAVDMGQDSQVHLYRAGRELLVNAVKHSGAKKVNIKLGYGDGRVTLSVIDEGKGFDPAGVAKGASGGFGLFSLRERLQPLGGELLIESRPGRGSRISVSLPLAAA